MADIEIKMDNNVEAPPKYEDPPTIPQYTADAPPSYNSLFGKVKQVKDESNGNMDFGCKLIGIICCNIVVTVIGLILCISIPIACIVIGAMNLHNCTIERYIPIYLIVSGSFGLVKAIISTICTIKNKTSEDHEDDGQAQNKTNPVEQIINIFLFAWFIAGSVWVYSIYGKVNYDDETSILYCDKTAYLFTFILITITYALAALSLLLCCCACVVACCLMGKE